MGNVRLTRTLVLLQGRAQLASTVFVCVLVAIYNRSMSRVKFSSDNDKRISWVNISFRKCAYLSLF